MPDITRVSYGTLSQCIRISNGTVEVVVSTEVGPRVLHYGFVGGENVLGTVPELSTPTPWGSWKPLGGHRLWAAPEAMPRSYAPDDQPVEHAIDADGTVRLRQPTDNAGIRKEMTVKLAPSGTGVTLRHTLTNATLWSIEVAPWALTIMNGGGVTILPHEPFLSHDEALLPARPLVLWPFTDMGDPRWTWGSRGVLLRSDPERLEPQKVGAMNTLGWCAYHRERILFVKRFPYEKGAAYPDFGCNNEAYTAGLFAEVESLGPLQKLEPGESTAEHVEQWTLVPDLVLPAGDHDATLGAVRAVQALMANAGSVEGL